MSDLPLGWIECRLDDLITEGPSNGWSPKSGSDATGSLTLKLSATTGGAFVANEDTTKRIYEVVPPDSKLWLEPGDVLIQRANTLEYVGTTAMFDGAPHTYIYPDLMMRIRLSAATSSRYIVHWLSTDSARNYFRAAATGTSGNMPKISGATVRSAPVLLAPLPEQKRIADKLDALLGRVVACRERLDRVPGILKRFRQSVLAAATTGELTREWREERGLPTTDYDVRLLGELIREPLRNGKSVRDGDGVLVLRLSSLRSGAIDWREAKRGDWGDLDVDRFLVEEGDFLVARGNGSRDLVGRGSLVLGAPPLVAFPDTMIRIRPDPSRIVPRFLRLVWDAATTRYQIELSARTTAGIWKVAQPDLEAISLPLPALDEQVEITRRAEELLGFADKLDVRGDAARARVNRLAPAILAKAFHGELVPQDAIDEPASELLARSKQFAHERDAGESAPKRPRRKAS